MFKYGLFSLKFYTSKKLLTSVFLFVILSAYVAIGAETTDSGLTSVYWYEGNIRHTAVLAGVVTWHWYTGTLLPVMA